MSDQKQDGTLKTPFLYSQDNLEILADHLHSLSRVKAMQIFLDNLRYGVGYWMAYTLSDMKDEHGLDIEALAKVEHAKTWEEMLGYFRDAHVDFSKMAILIPLALAALNIQDPNTLLEMLDAWDRSDKAHAKGEEADE